LDNAFSICPLCVPIQQLSHTFTESADAPTSPAIPEKEKSHCAHCNIQMSLLYIAEWGHFLYSALRTLNEVQDESEAVHLFSTAVCMQTKLRAHSM